MRQHTHARAHSIHAHTVCMLHSEIAVAVHKLEDWFTHVYFTGKADTHLVDLSHN